jgi:phospholipase/carboxylesterase
MPGLDALAHVIRPAAGDPEAALVLMLGRGTNERDLAGPLEVLDPERRFVGACPRGPLELPPMGFHWYAVRRIGYPDPATFRASYALLGEWLEALAEHIGVPPERTVLGGFSQEPVIGVEFGRAACELATEAGAEVLYRESAVGHFIDPHVVPELTSWVQERRAPAPLA